MNQMEEYDWRDYFRKKPLAGEPVKVLKIASTVTPLSWGLLFLASLALFLMILWAFLGYIPITVSGRGLIVTEEGLTDLQAPLSGIVKALPVKVGDSIKKGDLLIEMSDPLGNVYSPSDGKILEILIDPDNYVKEGTSLIWMEKVSSEDKKGRYLIYGYFPVESGKKLRPKTPVEMTLDSVNVNQYGTLMGRVKSVSLFAVSKENMLNEIQNPILVDYLGHQSPTVIKVLVEPEYVAETHPPKFIWSSGLEPNVPITTGTLVTLEATVEKVRPIYYLLPLSQFKSSSEDVNGN